MDDFDNAEYQSAREALEAIRGKWRKDIRTKDAGTIERRLLHYLDFEDLRQQTQWHRMINSIIREYSELIAAHMANLTIPGSETENQIKSRRDEFYRYPLEYSEEEHRYLNQLFIAFLAKVATTPWPEDFVGQLCFDEAEDCIGDDQILEFAGLLMIGALERLRTAIEIACELPEHGMFGGDMPYENDITDLTGFELVVLQRAAAQIRPIWPITVNTDLVNRTIDMNSDSIKETGAPRSLDWSAYQTAERHMIEYYAYYHMDQRDKDLMHKWMAG